MTSTTQLMTILSIMIIINSGLYLFQEAVFEVNPNSEQFFDVTDSPYSSYVVNGSLVTDDSYLPSNLDVDTEDTGNTFTDTYSTMVSWFKEKLAPLGFIGSILKQPYGFLKDIHIPLEICLSLSVLWYLGALLLIVSWWGGR